MKKIDMLLCSGPGCRNVAHPISSGAEFCEKCGEKLAVIKCEGCENSIVSREHKFCIYCKKQLIVLKGTVACRWDG